MQMVPASRSRSIQQKACASPRYAPESFEAGHVVLTVAPGGKKYRLAYVTADDESMKVTGTYDFVSKGKTRG